MDTHWKKPRDRRRDNVIRAMKSLVKRGLLRIDNGKVSFTEAGRALQAAQKRRGGNDHGP